MGNTGGYAWNQGRNAGNRGGDAENQSRNVGNWGGGNEGNQGAILRIGVEMMNKKCGE